MFRRIVFRKVGLGAMLLAFALPAMAQWELDSAHSGLYFISDKNASVAETHHFNSLVGYIGKDGDIQLSIDLNSVDTMIPIRNDRLKEMLFETARFPTAKVSTKVDPAILEEVAKGATVNTEVPVSLELHGMEKSLTVPVTVFSDGGSMRVMTPHPVVIRAEDFGLAGGVEALRAVASLKSISTAVPVSFSLLFKQAE